jgi:hypothetical protein
MNPVFTVSQESVTMFGKAFMSDELTEGERVKVMVDPLTPDSVYVYSLGGRFRCIAQRVHHGRQVTQ